MAFPNISGAAAPRKAFGRKPAKPKVLADGHDSKRRLTKGALAKELFELASFAQARGWSAEELLTGEIKKRERILRRREKA